jgi:hypothetical protein
MPRDSYVRVGIIMSQWIEQREAFYRIAIARGMVSAGELSEAFPLGSSLPPGKMEKWLDRFTRLPKGFSKPGRYVNRFKIGADPEFTFMVPGKTDARKDASSLKLKQGPAFGADNNGRLAEIRPHPSRSVVEVLASTLATLRWCAVLCPYAVTYEWHAGAWSVEDGLGGHVHFGRKRPNRRAEIAALDVISETLLDVGLFDADQQARRRAGDARRQLYGQVGDYRLQTHGYEYRTFPSWLDSPQLAFLTMTLAKLAVFEPGMVWRFERGPKNTQRMLNLLRYYKHCDDDARLALMMMQDGRFVRGGDFKSRWGIEAVAGIKGLPTIVPMSIKPSREDVEEMFDCLIGKKPLGMRIPTPTWAPTTPPRGYRMLIDNTTTIQRKGIGELCWDICYSEHDHAMSLHRDTTPGMSMKKPISVYKPLWERLPNKELFSWHRHEPGWVSIHPQAIDKGKSPEIRRMLLSGSLPLWKVRDVRPDSWEQWESYVKIAKKFEYRGTVMEGCGPLPGVGKG